MKVVFINTLYQPNALGGAEKTVQTLAEALVANGNAATVITLSPDGRRSSAGVGGVRVHYERLFNLYWPFGKRRNIILRLAWMMLDAFNPVMAFRVCRLLRDEKPDVVQTSNLMGFSCAVWLSARLLGIPIVQMLHDYYPVCANSATFRSGRNCKSPCGHCRFVSAPRRLLSRLPVGVISLSEATLSKVRRFGAFRRAPLVTVIHGAARLSAPQGLQAKPPADVLRLGYLGRIEGNKGIEILMSALHRIKARRPVQCVLAGHGQASYIAELQSKAPDGLARFIGRVDPAALFGEIDVLVVPSEWEEPLGRVIYEAYFHGIPCVVSDAGGMKEIVRPGMTGEVFRSGDPGELDAALLRLEMIDHGLLRANCLRTAAEFDISDRYPAYERMWTAVMDARPAP